MAIMTGDFTKAIQGRFQKNLKVPADKAKDLYSSMVSHGAKRIAQAARKKGKTEPRRG